MCWPFVLFYLGVFLCNFRLVYLGFVYIFWLLFFKNHGKVCLGSLMSGIISLSRQFLCDKVIFVMVWSFIRFSYGSYFRVGEVGNWCVMLSTAK